MAVFRLWFNLLKQNYTIMRYADYQEAWEMKPRKLSIEEIEDPAGVVKDFFEFVHLPQARWYLWEMLRTMVTDSYSHLKCREKSALVLFFEQLEKLIEVVHVMHEMNYYRPLSVSDRKNDVCSRLE